MSLLSSDWLGRILAPRTGTTVNYTDVSFLDVFGLKKVYLTTHSAELCIQGPVDEFYLLALYKGLSQSIKYQFHQPIERLQVNFNF